MKGIRRRIDLGFSEERVLEGAHICLIYNNEEERRHIMAKFIESGLEGGERFLYLIDTMPIHDFYTAMAGYGLDIDNASTNLIVKDALPVYCPSGFFSCPDMLDVVGKFYQQALNEGCSGARGTGEMSWSLVEGCCHREDLMEYEAKLNRILETYPYTACCQYDARRFDGQTIMDILSVHPMMIVRGQVVRNPYYIEPELFLDEYHKRLGREVHA